MLPGITERQAGYARDVGASARAPSADVEVAAARPQPRRHRAQRARVRGGGRRRPARGHAHLRAGHARRARAVGHAAADLPGQRPARARGHGRVGHGGPDLQPGRPRRAGHGQRDDARGRPLPRHHRRLAGRLLPRRGRAAGRARRARSPRGGRCGGHLRLPDDRDGRHPRRRGRAAAHARPAGAPTSPRATCTAAPRPWSATAIDAALAEEDERFEIDPALSDEEREDHIRMQIALERILRERGCGAYSTHFDAIAEDGRFARLPMAAASTLMAQGLRLRRRGRRAHRRAGRRRPRAARRRALHRDVRDGLPDRLDPHEPHGGGQLARRPHATASRA